LNWEQISTEKKYRIIPLLKANFENQNIIKYLVAQRAV